MSFGFLNQIIRFIPASIMNAKQDSSSLEVSVTRYCQTLFGPYVYTFFHHTTFPVRLPVTLTLYYLEVHCVYIIIFCPKGQQQELNDLLTLFDRIIGIRTELQITNYFQSVSFTTSRIAKVFKNCLPSLSCLKSRKSGS